MSAPRNFGHGCTDTRLIPAACGAGKTGTIAGEACTELGSGPVPKASRSWLVRWLPVPAPAPARVPALLYPMMVIAAIAFSVFSAVGIATVAGWMPHAMMSGEPVAVQPGADLVVAAGAGAVSDVLLASPAFHCAECGVINSVRALERDAVSAPVMGYPGI